MTKGPDWFKSVGTAKSTGLKIFSVSGDCARPGVYEFPMGITVAQLLSEVGGENAKAVQVGGASGRCVPASEFGRTLAFEDIPTGGSIIVFSRERDMLAVRLGRIHRTSRSPIVVGANRNGDFREIFHPPEIADARVQEASN
jgi:[NiFe] hydrogenase diaphorase moiety large subunit